MLLLNIKTWENRASISIKDDAPRVDGSGNGHVPAYRGTRAGNEETLVHEQVLGSSESGVDGRPYRPAQFQETLKL